MTVEFLDEQKTSKVEFLDEPQLSSKIEFIDEEPRKLTDGLFGTSIGEKSPLLAALREPARLSKEGLKKLINFIPEPEKPSVMQNILLNIPKTTAEIGADFSSSILEPESAILGIAGKGISALSKVKALRDMVGKGIKKLPLGVRKIFEYRAGQPEAYKELAENRISEIAKGGEVAKETGIELSKGLPIADRQRLGQIIKGGVSVSEKESGLRVLAEKSRDQLTKLGSEAVDEGLLDEQTFLNNVKTYMPRLYKKYELAEKGTTLKEFFGGKPERIVGKRFLQREEIPTEIRNAMGEIKEPAYPIAKGIAQLTHDVETAKMFRQVAENPEWSSDIPKEGFTQITGTAKKLGKLANKYVHPQIAEDINEITKGASSLDKLVSAWKFGKVVPNVSTHARNMMSNTILMDLSGVDFFKQPALLARSLKEMVSRGKFYTEAKEANLLGNEFVGGEIKDLLDSFPKEANNVWELIKNATSKMAKFAGDTYQKEEQLFKLAKFIHERELGASVKEAVLESEKWLFNYNKVSPFIKSARKSIIGVPFITFTSKSLPRIAETAMTNPLRLYKYKLMGDSIENIAKENLDISNEEVNAIKRNSRGQVLILPWKDEKGNVQTLDLSYILPWGDIGEQGGMFKLPPSLSPGGLVKPIAEVGLNYSQFRKKPIYLESDDSKTKLSKGIDYLYKSFFPSFAPPIPFLSKGGYSTEKLKSAIEEKPDYFGRVRSVSTVLTDVFLGLKASPVDPKIMGFFEKVGLKKELEEIKNEYSSVARNKGTTEEEKNRARQIAERKLSNLMIKKSGIENE